MNTFTRKVQKMRLASLGFSLIELMVAMVIGLVMTLAIFGVMSTSEGRKRSTTSVNDIDQVATYTVHQLDKYIRSAGSGFSGGVLGSEAYHTTYGCPLQMASGGVQLAPLASFSTPFNTVPGAVRMVPVLIYDGGAPNGDDVLVTMSGNSGFSELATDLTAVPTATSLTLKNVVPFQASDIILLANKNKTSIVPCMIEQVDAKFNPAVGDTALPLAGNYYQKVINGNDFTQFNTTVAKNAYTLNLGQQPTLSMFAVGTNNSLYRYNLLVPPASSSSDDPNPGNFAEGVFQMHAIYGVDPTDSGQITWVPPTGNYSAASLTDGSLTAKDRLRSIKAIRVGVVVKAALPEKKAVSPSSILLFSNSPVAAQVTVNITDKNYRYKTFEATIPLRNALFKLN